MYISICVCIVWCTCVCGVLRVCVVCVCVRTCVWCVVFVCVCVHAHVWCACVCVLDDRMIPYGCLSTGKDVGVIEIVKRAMTITAIQSCGGTRAAVQLDSSQLYKWIKEKNPDRFVGLPLMTCTDTGHSATIDSRLRHPKTRVQSPVLPNVPLLLLLYS